MIISYTTFRNILDENPDNLNKFKNGYAVRIQPAQYFDGGVDNDKNIKLGENAFVYYKTIKDFKKYKPKDNWNQVVELYTSNNKEKKDKSWDGEYALFIKNTQPQIVTHICGGDKNTFENESKKQFKKRMSEKYKIPIDKLPKQSGLGNFDYDYCDEVESEKIMLQLSYFIMSVPGMAKQLYAVYQLEGEKAGFNKSTEAVLKKGFSHYQEYFNSVFQDVKKICEQYNLLDYDLLKEVRAFDKRPICPLCLENLEPSEFLEIAAQVEGREEEDNTRSEISLMHINGLKPGEINHATYNLGWGHRMCNTIQEDNSIQGTLNDLERILNIIRNSMMIHSIYSTSLAIMRNTIS